MNSHAQLLIFLRRQLDAHRYGEAVATRGELARRTGVLVLDAGPSRGVVADRSGELPPGISELAGTTLDDAMGRIGRRVMRAEWGDNGRLSGVEAAKESGLASPESCSGTAPGGAVACCMAAPTAQKQAPGEETGNLQTGGSRGSDAVRPAPQPGQPPATAYRGPSVDGIVSL